MKVIGVIPARYESMRLPGKMLREIGGHPLIQLVYENAKEANCLDDLIVATDNEKILQAIEKIGGKAVLTDSNHPSGTDRIIEVIQNIDCDVVINIQGDEPFLDPKAIDDLVAVFGCEEDLQVATLCFKTTSKEVYEDPHAVKVVFDDEGFALYFSRASIPFYREGEKNKICYKHFGVYGYRKDFLLNFSKLSKSSLEESEKLEQLRILQSGERIKVLQAERDSLGIDTEEDLKEAEKLLKGKTNV